MSLEQPGTSKKVRARNQRTRPRLVTEPTEGPETATLAPDTEKLAVDIPEISSAAEPVAAPKPRRLPGFFSTIGKNDQENKAKEVDVAQARLARATRGKVTQSEKAASAKQTETKTTRAATSKAPARPTSTFKTRYILGMAIYLLGASYIGGLEQAFLTNAGLERLLTTLNLFGASIPIKVSTLLFLATLVIVLVILAKLDLIPRSLTGMSNTPAPTPAAKPRTKAREQAPPAVTSGDKLYQEYKASQRREKKR